MMPYASSDDSKSVSDKVSLAIFFNECRERIVEAVVCSVD